MGRGYSGSTMLSSLIGNSDSIENVGELISGMRRYPNTIVSSGRKITEDPFWCGVTQRSSTLYGKSFEEIATLLFKTSHPREIVSILGSSRNSHKWSQVILANKSLQEAIKCESNKEHFLDSSKDVTRALSLLKTTADARVIYLVRDIASVIASCEKRVLAGEGFQFLRRRYHGKQWESLFIFVTAASWTVGNLIRELICSLYSSRVLRVRYERICANPEKEFFRIGEFLGVDMSGISSGIKDGAEFAVGQGLGGNRIRFSESFVFNPDVGKVAKFSRRTRLFSILGLPLKLFRFYR
tara:strand:- start:4813 stop:5703 length:891 start_codon:yes stop_codon:yes gene_type:complete